MLSPPDAALAQRDSALPGLRLLLDPDAFAETLRTALPDAGVEAARATYVRYKPGTNCLVAYQLQVDGNEIDVYAKCYRPDARTKLEKARTRLGVCGPLGPGGIILKDEIVVVYVFPNDYKLATLAYLGNQEDQQHLFAKLLPERTDLWGAWVRRLRYKPERRYVAQMQAGTGERALLKIYAEREFPAARRNAKAFESQGLLQVARQLGASDRHRALVLEWVAGHVLDKVLNAPGFDPGTLRVVGAALAALHAQSPEGLGILDQEAERSALFAAAGAVAAVCPHLARRARRLALQLAAGLIDVSQEKRPIHGDFSADQVLLTEKGVAILDLDAAVQSVPAADLGSFIARLIWDVLHDRLSTHQAEGLAHELLVGYRLETGRDLPRGIRLYTAAGLLRLAPHPFRSREPDWPAQTAAILEQAELCL